MNTKLVFIVTQYTKYDETGLLGHINQTVATIKERCGYNFDLPMPVKLEMQTVTGPKTVKKFFGSGTKTVQGREHIYSLVFDKELTEQELNYWRMFKVGWFTHTR